jgi:hypothetical protein
MHRHLLRLALAGVLLLALLWPALEVAGEKDARIDHIF